MSLYDNAEKYISSNYIDSNKIKNQETHIGYYDLDISDQITENSPYASNYWFVLDKNNIIHSIYGDREVEDLSNCLAIIETLSERIEDNYEIEFEYWEPSFPGFRTYSYYHYNILDAYYAIQCKEEFETSQIILQIYFDTNDYADSRDAFYDSL